MTRRLVLVVAALALVLAACGSGVEEIGGGDVPVDTKPDDPGATTVPEDDDGGIPPGQDPRDILGEEEAEEDAAAQACFEGDMSACDELFTISLSGGNLESYSQTCGGRIEEQEGAPNCVGRFAEPVAPGDLTDDPELADSDPDEIARFEELADECFGGDLAACDDLFLETPVDSDFEAYGSTCGGRLEDGVSGSCESQLGSVTDTTTSTD